VTVNIGVRWDHTHWPETPHVRNDVAPRLGIAVDPWRSGQTVIRSAVGRYYDDTFLPIARDAELGFTQLTIMKPGYQGDVHAFDPYGPNPNRNGPAIPSLSITRYAPIETPYTDQVSVGLERQVGANIGVSADLVRALGHRLEIGWDLNYPDALTGVRPDSRYLQILTTETIAQSWYTGLQVGVRRRLAHGYAYSVAYTLSSAENDTDGRGTYAQNQLDVLADRGPAANDAPHRVAASATIDLPFKCLLAALVTAHSGLPYNETTGGDDNRDGQSNDRPVGVSRNSLRGSPYFDADVRLSKVLPLRRTRLELMAEVFNVTNHANLTDYSGVQSRPTTFEQPASAGPPRQLQLGVRFDF
jgi:hypothetical protein